MLSAVHNPNFSSNDLEKKSRFEMKGVILKNGNQNCPFLLTNLDEVGCFVLLDADEKIELEEVVEIQIELEGALFKSTAKCVSLYDKGAGFSFALNHKDLRSLSGLYQVCLDRGMV